MAIVTLSSDFGTRDSYQAELKGVLLSEGAPDLRLVDLSHDLAPFDVPGAALFVRNALPRFPPGTIHVVVVDPGVGSARRPLVARAHGQFLVGPDNGVFSHLFEADAEVHAIDVGALGRAAVASTFHGRDVFAPVAARLSHGAQLASLGPRVHDPVRLALPPVEAHEQTLLGQVIQVDGFGNLVSNISETALGTFMASAPGRVPVVHFADHAVHGLADHYAQVAPGQKLALIGSSGLLEMAVREGHAARLLGVALGATVRVSRA